MASKPVTYLVVLADTPLDDLTTLLNTVSSAFGPRPVMLGGLIVDGPEESMDGFLTIEVLQSTQLRPYFELQIPLEMLRTSDWSHLMTEHDVVQVRYGEQLLAVLREILIPMSSEHKEA
jgi:hypothetical protein